jgi:hypothetical protein
MVVCAMAIEEKVEVVGSDDDGPRFHGSGLE